MPGDIRSIDERAARALPGLLDIFTYKTLVPLRRKINSTTAAYRPAKVYRH